MRVATRSLTGVVLALALMLAPRAAHATPPDWEPSFGPRFAHTDDSCSQEVLPFTFRFYGVAYARVYVSSNGTLSFLSCNSTPNAGFTSSTPLIAPLWADLYPTTPGGVYHRVTGTAPDRVLVTTWYLVPEYTPRTALNTFQVKLYERTGRIQLGYDGLLTDGFTGTEPQRVGIYPGGATEGLIIASGAEVRALDQTNVCFVPNGSDYTLQQGPCVQPEGAPKVAFTPAPAALVNHSPLEVTGVLTDAPGVSKVMLRLDGAWMADLPVAADGTVRGNVHFPGEGSHTVSLEAVNASGARAVANAQVVYDATGPSVSLAALPALTATRELQVAGSVADASGVVSAELVLNGERQPVTPAADGSVSVTLQLQEGPNALSLVAVDAAGNAAASQASVTLDTRAPQVSVLAPTSGQVLGSSSVELTLQVADDSAMSASVQGLIQVAGPGTHALVFPVVIAAEGPATFSAVVQDAAGNASTVSVDVVLDLSAPLLSLEHVGGRPLLDAERFGPQPGDGLALNARVEDLSATQVVFGHGTRHTVAAGGGVLAEWVPLSEGLNVVEVSATDEAGQRSVLRRSVVYDVTPPQGTLELASFAAVQRGSVEVVARASDNLTGISGVSFRVDADAWQAGSADPSGSWALALDTALLSDGAHTVSALLQDGVGNVHTVSLPLVVDNTAPALELAALPPSARGVITLQALASDATSGVAEVVLEVNGLPVHRCTGAALTRCEVPFDTAALPDGPFLVSARASDAAGNAAAPVQRSSEADNLGPVRFLTSPLPGAVVTRAMQVTVDVRDAAFARVECFVGGISLGSSTDPRFSAAVDLRDRMDGPLEVRCLAEDSAGNVGTETVTVQVHNWTLALNPGSLDLRASRGLVTLLVEGHGVDLLLPIESRDLKLRVPGGSPVPVLEHRASEQVGDANRNGVPDVALKLERKALVRSLLAGIVARAIDPRRPIRFELVSGTQVVASYTLTVKR